MTKTHVAVFMHSNWADEMDLDVVELYKKEKYDEMYKDICDAEEDAIGDLEFGVGTNEYVSFNTKQDIFDSMRIVPITEEEFDFLNKLFKGSYFGPGVSFGDVHESLMDK